MKIIQVCKSFPPLTSGVANHVYNLSYELSLRGHQVTVLTTDIKNSSFFKINRADKPYEKITDNFEVYRFKAYPPGIPYASAYGIIPALIKKLLKLNPDVINTHSHGLIHTDITSVLSKIKKVPLVLTIHSSGDTAARPYTTPLLKFYNYTIGKFSLKAANRIIVTSPQMVEYFSRFMDEEKFCIIPYGIKLERLLNMPLSHLFKKDYDLDRNVVLFIGRLAPVKGIQYLLKAAPQVLREVPDTSFVIVGSACGDYNFQKELEKLSHKLGVNDKVIFTGYISDDELLNAYSAANVFVLPTLREGLPIVTLEAMAAGKPVVASNVGGLPSIVKDGVTGFLAEPKNVGQLADSIIKLLLNEKMTREMGDNARDRVKDFSWEKIAKETEKAYKEAIQLVNRRKTVRFAMGEKSECAEQSS